MKPKLIQIIPFVLIAIVACVAVWVTRHAYYRDHPLPTINEVPPAPYLCPSSMADPPCAIKPIKAWVYLNPQGKLIGICANYEGKEVCTPDQHPKELQ